MQRFSRLTKKQRVIIFVSCLFVSCVGSHVMSLVTMALPHVVIARSEGVKAEDKNDPVREALIQLATFILHPDNQHFAEMRNYFTLSRLSTFVTLLLGSMLNSVFTCLCDPFMPRPEEPEEFVDKPWKLLTAREVRRIKNQPYKYLRLRYGINPTAGVLYPIIRLIFIHVIPATIVLRWGFDEVATDVWQLLVKAFFMIEYVIYLPAVVFMFIETLVYDKVQFAALFLLPMPQSDPIENLWDERDSGMAPLQWLGGLLIWCTFGLEIFLRGAVHGSTHGPWWPNAFWLLLITKWLFVLVCLCFCLIFGPQPWNLAGIFLGSMNCFGFCVNIVHILDFLRLLVTI